MDDPGIDARLLKAAFDGLRRVNSFCTSRFAIRRHLARAAGRVSTTQQASSTLRVLDLGCGTGDVAMWLTRSLKKRGVDVVVDGCDISPVAIMEANAMAAKKRVEGHFFRADLMNDDVPEGYHFAVSSLFCHHFDEASVVSLLKKASVAVQEGLLIDDLRRTRTGLVFAQVGCQLLSRSPVVHADGPQSVRAAFTIDEFRSLAGRAGLDDVDFEPQWPQRFLMVWHRNL